MPYYTGTMTTPIDRLNAKIERKERTMAYYVRHYYSNPAYYDRQMFIVQFDINILQHKLRDLYREQRRIS